jgi:hypothetical protein
MSNHGNDSDDLDQLRSILKFISVAIDAMDGVKKGAHPLDAIHAAWKGQHSPALDAITVPSESAPVVPAKGPGPLKKGQCIHRRPKRICPNCFKK